MVNRFRYYNRWNFNNLTLRAVSVVGVHIQAIMHLIPMSLFKLLLFKLLCLKILERPKVFQPEMLTSLGYTAGVSAMTKITAQLLYVLMEQHNFR